jgi:hypothetical protein
MTFQTSDHEWLSGLPEPLTDDFARLDEPETSSPTASTSTASNPAFSSAAMAVGVAAVAGTMLLNTGAARAVSPPIQYSDAIFGTGDVKILNYALSLEALEADLYRQALARVTALGVASTEIDARYYARFGAIEAGHRDFLDGALGPASIIKPGKPLGSASFNFGINSLSRAQVAELVLDAERTGVAAYLGVLPSLSTANNYRQIAAAIQGTEARHTTVIYIIINRLARAGTPGFTGGRNVAPVRITESDTAQNDIQKQGREPLTAFNGGEITLITTGDPNNDGVPGPFEPRPVRPATPQSVLNKVSPFIVLG